MKKIVFLFCLLLSITFTTDTKAFDNVFEFTGFTIELDQYRNGNSKGYHITKTGVEPFRISIEYPESDILIYRVKQVDNMLIYHGSIHIEENETYYDAYYLITDLNGNVLKEYKEDFGDLEEVRNVFVVDNVLIAQIEENYDSGDQFEFTRYIFKSFDEDYNPINEVSIFYPIYSFKVTDNYFLYSHDYTSNFIGGLRSDLSIIEYDDIPDIPLNAEYQDSFYLDFINEATLNGDKIFNGLLLEYPGNYTFTYNDSSFEFTIASRITGVENNGVYTTPVYPFLAQGNATLNNDIFLSGDEISLPGYYTLSLYGSNGYTKDVSFTITSDLDGILNNQVYADEVDLVFNGTGYINNQHIESPYTISEEGDYVLKITGENNYLETYFFSIDYPESNTSLISFVQKYDIIILGIVAVSGVITLKKK